MLQKELWGNSLSAWGISIAIIIGAIVIVKLISVFSRKIVRPFITRTRNNLDDVIYSSLEPPIKFAIMLLGIWISIHRLVYPDSVVKIIDNIYKILIVLDITWVFARLTGGLMQTYWGCRADGQINRMMPVIRRSILVIVWIVGGIMALSNIGVNISTLLGTLGVGGIAFALAAQDTIKNIFGAFTIFTDKPFSIGDIVRIDNYEGTVIDVGVRSTRILGYDKRIVTLPNYKVADNSIVNVSSEPMRRVVLKLGLTYDTTFDSMQEALEILRAVPRRVKNVSDDPADIIAYFSEYADSALEITYIYHILKSGNIQQVTSDMNMAILNLFNKAGLNFAFPTQTLYIAQQNIPQMP